MRIGDVLGSFLKADDLGNARVRVVIDRVELKEIDDKTKAIMYFQGKAKGLVINLTIAEQLKEIFQTDETDHWIGRQIILYRDASVMFGGKRVGGVRVASAETGTASAPTPPPPPPSPPPDPEWRDGQGASDDDIPF